MYRIFSALIVLAFLLPSCQSNSNQTEEGKESAGATAAGKRSERIFKLEPFTGIDLRIAAEVELSPGDLQEVLIQADAEVLDHLDTSVKNGLWAISSNKRIVHEDIKIFITSPLIHRVILSSSGSIDCTGIFKSNEDVELKLSGSGNIHYLTEAKNLLCEVTGSGDIRAEGKAENLEVEISGSGSVNATNLEAEDAEVEISGSGDCDVDARDDLDVKITGSGLVRYKGEPKVRSRIQGSGNIRPM